MKNSKNIKIRPETSANNWGFQENSPISVETKISLSNSIGKPPSNKNNILFEQRIGIVLNHSKNIEKSGIDLLFKF